MQKILGNGVLSLNFGFPKILTVLILATYVSLRKQKNLTFHVKKFIASKSEFLSGLSRFRPPEQIFEQTSR